MGSSASSGQPRWAAALSWLWTPRSRELSFVFFPFFVVCLLTQVCGQTRCDIAPKFSHDSGSDWLSQLKDSHNATIKIMCCVKS